MTDKFTYHTISSDAKAEFKDRGSRFIALGYAIQHEADVKKYLLALKQEHPKAVHICYAYRLGVDGTRYRAVDDGEPSGSAGKPILGQIDSAGLTNVVVFVVRYFGGVLLGVPGLINAYKSATAAALSTVDKLEKNLEKLVEIAFDYPVMNEVKYLLKLAGATIYKQELQLFCLITAGIPLKEEAQYLQRLETIRGVTIKEGT